jgi:hypothetical protein
MKERKREMAVIDCWMVYDDHGNALGAFDNERDADALAARYPDLVVIGFDEDGMAMTPDVPPTDTKAAPQPPKKGSDSPTGSSEGENI